MKWLVAGIVTVGAAFYAQSVQGQQDTVKRLRAGCHLSRRLQIERDTDLGNFASDAAVARRRSGDVDVARQYDRIAQRAARRVVLQTHRSCETAYPLPSLLP